MMAIASNQKYDGCSDKTVKQNITVLAQEGKTECEEFHCSILHDGLKPAASGDLWSKNGCALFGLVSHGIQRIAGIASDGSKTAKWTMKEKLAGSIPCAKDRHTGTHIAELSNAAWAATGLKKPIEEIFARVSDNGTNMIKGWEDGFQIPCADHTMELSINLFTHHDAIASTFEKGRGMVGYFNSSVVGYNEEAVGLHACQKSAGVSENRLTQDVKTRWRSTHAMANSLRISMEALLLYDIRSPKAAQGFKDNRYSLEDWKINNESVALLAPLAKASQFLEGKNYPTSNLVIPSLYGCIELLAADSPIQKPWDKKILQPTDLCPEVVLARSDIHADLVKRWKTNLPAPLQRFYFIATLLDPRQKALRFPGNDSALRKKAIDWFESEYDSLWGPAPQPQPQPQRAATPEAPCKPGHAQHEGACFHDFMASLAHLQTPTENPAAEEAATVVKSEAKKYLEAPPVDMKADILTWWASNEENYPYLSKMAAQYLGIPATSASAERLFSIAGRVYDDLSQHMNDSMLEERMWARINREKRCGK